MVPKTVERDLHSDNLRNRRIRLIKMFIFVFNRIFIASLFLIYLIWLSLEFQIH
jgi:hypothetical protein